MIRLLMRSLVVVYLLWGYQVDVGAAICGDSLCQSGAGENTTTCCQDCCAAYCGDFLCEPQHGENGWTCPQDCIGGSGCGDNVCNSSAGEDYWTCPSDCGAVCRDNWCDPGEYTTCRVDCDPFYCETEADCYAKLSGFLYLCAGNFCHEFY